MSSFKRQISALTRKNVRWMLRRKTGATSYILFPSLVVLAFFVVPMLVDLSTVSNAAPSNGQNNSVAVDYWPRCTDCDIQIAFAPNTPEYAKICEEMRLSLGLKASEVVGYADNEALLKRVAAGWISKTQPKVNCPILFQNEVDLLNDSMSTTKVVPGKGNTINYRLYADYRYLYSDKPIASGDPVDESFGGYSGVALAFQRSIDQAIISTRLNAKASIQLNVSAFEDISNLKMTSSSSYGYYSPVSDATYKTYALGILLVVCGIACFFLAVLVLSDEKSSKLLMSMRLVGLIDTAYWISWILGFTLLSMVSALCAVLVGIIFNDEFFYNANIFILWMSLTLFFIGCSILAFPITALFNRSRTSFACAFLVFLIAVLVPTICPVFNFFVMHNPMEYYDDPIQAGAAAVNGGLSIFPPYHFIRLYYSFASISTNQTYLNSTALYSSSGLNSYQIIKHVGRPYRWDDLFSTVNISASYYVQLPGAGMKQIFYVYEPKTDFYSLSMLFVTSIIWFVIAWYFGQVMGSSNGGAPLPFYFPLQWRYWFSKSNATTNESDDGDGDGSDRFQDRIEFERQTSKRDQSIRTWNLSRSFKNVQACKEITFEMKKNEIFGLLGVNQSGKTTLVNMLCGALEPTSGECFVMGYDVRTEMPSIRKMLGICPQENILWPDLSPREHLELYAGFKDIPKDEVKGHIEELLEIVHLNDQISNQKVSTFSGGQKRRLCLSIALVGYPRILLLDELSTSLDPHMRQKMWDVIENVKNNKNEKGDHIILLTTHLLEEADSLCTTVGILATGRLRALGSPLFLKSNFGRGYSVNLTCNESDVSHVLTTVRKYVPEAELLGEDVGTMSISIPQKAKHRLPGVLKFLSGEKRVKEFGLSQSKLEDVFLRLASQNHQVNSLLNNNDRFHTDTDKCALCHIRATTDVVLYTESGLPVELSGIICSRCAAGVEEGGVELGSGSVEEEEEEVEETDTMLNENENENENVENVENVAKSKRSDREMADESHKNKDKLLSGGQVQGKSLFLNQFFAFFIIFYQQRWTQRKTLIFEASLILLLIVGVGITQMMMGGGSYSRCPFYDYCRGPSSSSSASYNRFNCDDSGFVEYLMKCKPYTGQTNVRADDGYPNWDSLSVGYKQMAHIMVNRKNSSLDVVPFNEIEMQILKNSSVNVNVDFPQVQLKSDAYAIVKNRQEQIKNGSFSIASRDYSAMNTHFPAAAMLFEKIDLSASQIDVSFTIVGYDDRKPYMFIKYGNVTGAGGTPGSTYWSNYMTTPTLYRDNYYAFRIYDAIHTLQLANAVTSSIIAHDDPTQDIQTEFHFLPFRNYYQKVFYGNVASVENLTPDVILSLLLMIVVPLCLTLPFPPLLRILVLERQSGLISLCRAIGLQIKAYYVAIWAVSVVYQVIVSLFLFSLCYVFQISSVKDNFGAGIGISILFGHALAGVSIFLSSLLKKDKTAGVVGYVFVLLSVFGVGTSTIILAIFSTPPSIPLFNLMPLFAFPRSISLLLANPQFPITSDSAELQNSVVFGLFVGGTVYFLLGMYLRAVLKDRSDGVSEPPLFLFHKIRNLLRKLRKESKGKGKDNPLDRAESVPMIHMDVKNDENVDVHDDAHEGDPDSDTDTDSDVGDERRRILNLNMNMNSSGDENPIIAESVTMKFGELVALDDVCLGIRKGECFGLLGANGSGKTTLINVLSGTIKPTHGHAFIDGVPVSKLSSNTAIGLMPQNDTQWPDLTVKQHLMLFARLKGILNKNVSGAMLDAAEMADIAGDELNMRSSDLSGGTKRRLSLALALIGNPRIVLLDEPSSSVDVESRHLIWTLIKRAKTMNRASLVLTTHQMQEAEALSTRIGILGKGGFRALGDTLHLKSKFGSGYRLFAHVQDESDDTDTESESEVMNMDMNMNLHVDKFKRFMAENWAESVCRKESGGKLEYHIPHSVDIGALLSKLIAESNELNVVDWGIQQTTLEAVFNRIAEQYK